jgi:hypothetical protein
LLSKTRVNFLKLLSESILTLIVLLLIRLLCNFLYLFDAFSGLQAFLRISTLAIRGRGLKCGPLHHAKQSLGIFGLLISLDYLQGLRKGILRLVLFVFLVLKSQIELTVILLGHLHLALHGLPLFIRLGLKDLEHLLRLIDILLLVREARTQLACGL